MQQILMVEHMDIWEEPFKYSIGVILLFRFPFTHYSCPIFAPFDATYEKIRDVLHQFDSFSQTSKTRIKYVVVIFWIICMRIFENMQMYKKNQGIWERYNGKDHA